MKGFTIEEATRWRTRMQQMGLTELQITGMANLAGKLQRDTILTAKAFATIGENVIKRGGSFDEAIAEMNLHHTRTIQRMRTGI
jgi:hypothetical protein